MRSKRWLFLVLGVISSTMTMKLQGTDFEDGDKIAILSGQNFETYAWSPSGYMRLVADELRAAGIHRNPWIFEQGVKTGKMLEVIEGTILEERPRLVVIIPGFADYNPWHNPEIPQSYRDNLEEAVRILKDAEIRTVLFTSYPYPSRPEFSPNRSEPIFSEYIRELAKTNEIQWVDFKKIVDEQPKPIEFDGNPAAKTLVNQWLAAELLELIGFSEDSVDSSREEWLKKPGSIQFMPTVSANTYEKLRIKAAAAGITVQQYMAQLLQSAAAE